MYDVDPVDVDVEVDVDALPNVIVPLNPVSVEVLVTIDPDDLRLLAVMASIICTSVTLAPLIKISSLIFFAFVNFEIKKWNYAVVEEPLRKNFLIAKKRGLAVVGDWCTGGNIESSFKSARSLSNKFFKEVI